MRQHEASAGAARSVNAETALFPFLYSLVAGHFVVALPIRAAQLTSDSLLLGLVGTTLQAGIVLFCFVCGRISDHVARWKMSVAGAFLCGAAVLTVSLARDILPLIVLSGLLGVSGALYWPSLEASIAEHTSQGRLARSLSVFNLSWASGLAVGSLLSGMLIGVWIWAPFLAGGLAAFVLGCVLLGYYTQGQRRRGGADPARAHDTQETYDIRAGRFLLLARLAVFGTYFALSSIRWLFPKLGMGLGLSSNEIGILMAALMATQTSVFFAMGRFRGWEFSAWPFFACPGVALAALLVIARGATMPPFVLGFCLLGGCAGVFYTMALFYSLHSPHSKGANAGLHETIIGSGALVGPIFGGGVARLAGLRAPLVLCAGVIVLTTCVQVGLWVRRRGSQVPQRVVRRTRRRA